MDSSLRPALRRQIVFLFATLSISMAIGIIYDPLVGMAAGMAIFVASIFYIRRRQAKALKSLGFGDNTGNERIKIKYACVSCGEEVRSAKCNNCGSRMKKPVF